MLTSGTQLLYTRGYQGTTVDAILVAAAAPKGSFYYHFGSKEAFGIAVLERYVVTQAALLLPWVARTELSVPDRLAGYHRELITQFVAAGWQHPCMAGKLSHELASSEAFRRRLSEIFNAWAQGISELLADGQKRHEVRTDRTAGELANAVLAMIQGAIVAAISLRDREYLDAVTSSIVDLVSVAP